jgi:hypothetical protein
MIKKNPVLKYAVILSKCFNICICLKILLPVSAHWENYKELHFIQDKAPSYFELPICVWLHNHFCRSGDTYFFSVRWWQYYDNSAQSCLLFACKGIKVLKGSFVCTTQQHVRTTNNFVSFLVHVKTSIQYWIKLPDSTESDATHIEVIS